jgi:hypothetical protein
LRRVLTPPVDAADRASASMARSRAPSLQGAVRAAPATAFGVRDLGHESCCADGADAHANRNGAGLVRQRSRAAIGPAVARRSLTM